MDMEISNAIRTINWQAKNFLAARYILSTVIKDMKDDSWIPDISVADARCIDLILQEHGIHLHLVENISKYRRSCERNAEETDCPLHKMKYAKIHKSWFRKLYCNECIHFKEGLNFTYREPETEMHNIKNAIKDITEKIDFLYALKKEALELSGAPVFYQKDCAGRIFRVYDLDGYKPHCPADPSEAKGEIPVSKTVLRTKSPLSIYQLECPVEAAVEFIEDYIERRKHENSRRTDS